MNLDAIEAPIEHREGALDNFVDVRRLGLGDREARQGRELIDEAAHGLDRPGNGFGAGANNRGGSGIGRSCAVEMALNAFCRKRNWRKLVLDLVGDAACHFAPRRLFLGLEQI